MVQKNKVTSDVNEDRDVAEYTVDVEEFFESLHVHPKPLPDKKKEQE
jgi:hypothetical protein